MTDAKHNERHGIKPVPRLLSVKQAIYELGVGRTMLYELLATDALNSVKIGRRRFIPRESIDEFVGSLRRPR